MSRAPHDRAPGLGVGTLSAAAEAADAPAGAGPPLQRRFDGSDVVQEALLKAHARLDQFRGRTEAELLKWLYEILSNTLVDEVRKAHAQKRDLALERSLLAAAGESSARLEAYLADRHPTPAARAERPGLDQ